MDILFYKVIHNKFLFKIILKYLKLYKKYSNKFYIFNKIQDYNNCLKIIEYIGKIEWNINLEIPNSENGNVEHLLLNNVKFLKFGKLYNQPINIKNLNSLESTEILSFEFNQQQFNLPTSIKKIYLNRDFNQPLENIISNIKTPNLNHISFGRDYLIEINSYQFPNSIKSIKFSNLFNQDLMKIKSDNGNDDDNVEYVLPNSLIKIEFGWSFNKSIQSLYRINGLKILKFGVCFNQMIEINQLPNTIEKLSFGSNWNQPIIDGSLPKNLKNLKFGNSFNQLINENSLPKNLVKLKFGSSFNQPIQSSLVLPHSLTSLEFNSITFDQHLLFPTNLLPINLKILKIYLNNSNSILKTTINNNNNNDTTSFKVLYLNNN